MLVKGLTHPSHLDFTDDNIALTEQLQVLNTFQKRYNQVNYVNKD